MRKLSFLLSLAVALILSVALTGCGKSSDSPTAPSTPAAGTIKISTDYPDYIPFMTYAADDDLRRQLYIQFQSRAAAHNEGILGKVLALRAEQAKLLGFADWADYISDDKMLRGGKAEQAFIDHLKSTPKTGLHNPFLNKERYLMLAEVNRKVVESFSQQEVFDFFTKALQRSTGKS